MTHHRLSMPRRIGAVLLGVGLCSALPAVSQLTIEDIARPPAISSMSMAADGSYLVGLIDNGGELALTVWNLDDPSQPPTGSLPGDRMKFVAAQALKAGKLFVVGRQEWTGVLAGCGEGNRTGATRTFVTKLYMSDVALEDFEEPFERGTRDLDISEATRRCFELAGEAGLAADLPLDPDSVIARRTNTTRLSSEYFRVNLRTGEETMVYRELPGESVGSFDLRTGEVLTKSTIEPAEDGNYEFQTLLRNAAGEYEVHEPLTYTAFDRYNLDVLGRDEATGLYYVRTDRFQDKAGIYFYDPEARAFEPDPLFATTRFEAGGVFLGRQPSDFNQLLGFTYTGATSQYYFIDPEWDSLYQGLKQAFPGRNISFLDYNDDKSRILFSTSASNYPPAYYLLYDRTRTVELGQQRPWVDPDSLRPTELVYYPARDGLQIPAFLTLPAGWTPEDGPLPAVVLPHGGPWARDSSDWDGSGWPQFLASRGYVVLQPQYRGSVGWGRELWLAGDGEWGRAMQDDKDDAAAWLVEQGYGDAARTAIFGYSYGGYAAMAAVVRPDGPFRCAIAGAGVSDLARLGNTWSTSRLQRAVQGRTVQGLDPLDNADQANIPVLIYGGDRDVRVPLSHSQQFYMAVREHVPATFIEVPDMPHSLPWYPEHHRVTLAAIEAFLAGDCGLQPGS